jgi:hypothetical protein
VAARARTGAGAVAPLRRLHTAFAQPAPVTFVSNRRIGPVFTPQVQLAESGNTVVLTRAHSLHQACQIAGWVRGGERAKANVGFVALHMVFWPLAARWGAHGAKFDNDGGGTNVNLRALIQANTFDLGVRP